MKCALRTCLMFCVKLGLNDPQGIFNAYLKARILLVADTLKVQQHSSLKWREFF